MDIEGEEYDVIFDTANETLKKFSIVHIHSNNNVVPIKHRGYEFPPFMEFTFLRKDRIHYWSYTKSFPHPLDIVNVPSKPDFALPKCWYQPVI